MHWLNQVIWFDYIYTVISQLWRLQSQPLHCWWNLGGPTRSCTMEKTWNSDQSLVIQRWARLLPLALVECSWERWQSLVVFCWLMFEMVLWKIMNLVRSDCADRHHVHDWIVIDYKDIWTWEHKNPIVYGTPKPYFHPLDGKPLCKRDPEQRIKRVAEKAAKRKRLSVWLTLRSQWGKHFKSNKILHDSISFLTDGC